MGEWTSCQTTQLGQHTIHTLSETPPQKKCTHQHCLSAKNPHENNKNQAKKLKVYQKMSIFTDPPPHPKCMVWTHENVDIYGLINLVKFDRYSS